MGKEKWQRRSAALLFTSLVLFGIYILLKYALVIFLPFLVALAVSLPLFSLAKRSSASLGGSVKAWCRFYVAVFWLIIGVIMTLALRKLYSQAQELMSYLGENIDMITDAVKSFTDGAMSFPSDSPLLAELGALGERIGEGITSALSSIGEKGSEALAQTVGKIAVGTPKAVVGTVVAIVASFYLCCDLDNIKSYLIGFLSEESGRKLRGLLSHVLGGIRAYAVAYFWLFIITFVELYLGLFILGRRYAFLIALFLALIDMLPLFGAGVFIVPWGIFLILNGDTASGVGLLILLGVMSITRQIVEPRLVGKKLGIHPLASLAAMYIGFRIFGFWGMILAPVAVLVIKEMRNAKEKAEQ